MQRPARRVTGLVFAAVSACAAAPVQSGILVWDGGSRVDGNWGTSLNWNPDQLPANGDGLTFAGSLRTSASNNMSALVVDRILFATGASSFSLSGNAFTIRATTPGIGGYIHNSSSSLQTINNAITFDGSGSINHLTTGANGPVTLNGAITLVNGALTVGGAQTVTLNGAIAGTGTASGIGLDATASLVLLNGANTYTGSTRVFSGSVLRLGNNSRIPDASTLDVGGTLQLNGFSEIVGGLQGGGQVELGSGTLQVSNNSDNLFTGSISGTGMFAKAGSGNLILSGSGTNSHSGGTQILQGTLTVSQFASNALPDSGAILVQGGTLKLDKSEVVGTVTLDSGQITGTGALQGSGFALRSGTVSAPLAGAAGLSKTTSGTVILNGSNTYSGSTSISGGTLQLGASNRLPDGTAVSISGGATLNLGTFSDTVGSVSLTDGSITGSGALTTAGVNAQNGSIGAVLAGSAGLTKSGAGTLTLSGANAYTGATVIDAGVLALAGGGQRIADASALSVNGGGIFRMNGLSETVASLAGAGSVDLGTATLTIGAGTTTFSGVISGSGGLTRQGSGVLTLAGANAYTGTTQVNGGTLALGASDVLADASAVRVGGGTLDLASFSDLVGSVTLLSGTIQGTTGALRSNAGFVLESGQVSARLAGDGGLTKNTTGLVTLGNTASYLGTTRINNGTLRLSAANALPAATAVDIATAGILDLNGFSATIGGLSGAGTVALGTGATLTVGTNDQSSVFAGTLTGAPSGGGTGGLVKTGAGTLTLIGSVQHAGPVRVSGGTLSLPNGLPLSGRSIDVAAGALAARGFVNRGLTVQPGGAVTATGDLIVGDLAGTGSVGIQGTLDVGSHLVQLIDRAGASVGGSVLIAQGGRLTTFDQARGMVLLPGGRVAASGESAIDGDFDNRGTVGGPSMAGAFLTFTDDVTGPGAYTGNVRFADGFSPGASPALVSLENAVFDATSVLTMELGGLLGGAQYDRLGVSGTLELQGGTLAVALIDGFVPQLGNEFDLLDWGQLTGTFGSLALPVLAQGLFWETGRLYADGTLSVAAVPEPGTWVLLLAGLIAIGVAADGRRRAAR